MQGTLWYDEAVTPLEPSFMAALIEVKKHAPSGTIVINRPDHRNALSRSMVADLLQAFQDFHLERKVRAVIVTGSGTSFSAGVDLKEVHASQQEDHAQAQWHADAMRLRELFEYMLRFPKPIIAAINGPAIAAGAGLALAADVVLGAAGATIGFPEPRRGLVAGLMAPLLHFRIGGGAAARLLLTADTIDAEEAYRIGLIHELVAHELLWARSHEIATRIAESAPESIQLTKKLLNETVGEQLSVRLSAGAAATAAARTTAAAVEGLGAFQEKRDPNWP